MGLFDGIISAASSLGSALIGARNSSSTTTTNLSNDTARFYYNEARAADARSLENSKELFSYQNLHGASQLMSGLKSAGLNPILAGGYTASMPSGQGTMPSSVPTSSTTTRNNRSALLAEGINNAIQLQLNRRLVDSQVQNLEANAASVRKRAENEDMLAQAQYQYLTAKAISEGHIPGRIASDIKKTTSDIMLNNVHAHLMQSQANVNAKQLEAIESLIQYRKDMIKAMSDKDYFNLPFGLGRFYFGSDRRSDNGFRVIPPVSGSPIVQTNPNPNSVFNGLDKSHSPTKQAQERRARKKGLGVFGLYGTVD